MSETH